MTTKNLGRLLATLALTAAVFAACGDDDDEPAVSGSTGATVTVENSTFEPEDLSANIEDSITFDNQDSIKHTVTPNRSGDFTGIELNPGAEVELSLPNVGVYAYHCSIHTTMRGTITIVAKGQ